MGLNGVVHVEVEVKSPAEKFWLALGDAINLFPKASPKDYKTIQLLAGDGGTPGSIILITYGEGGAWVLRDENGRVLLHSRRSFANCADKLAGQIYVIQWAIESMITHRQAHVIFEWQDGDIVKAFKRPQAWPSFYPHVIDCLQLLNLVRQWKVERVSLSENRGAFLIAQSAISDSSFHSYVEPGCPQWLSRVFREEES